jgi:ribokinase
MPPGGGRGRVLNFGSLNIDHVYRVNHISKPGETIAATGYSRFAGGKGANQSIAIARAGCQVAHIGKIGPEGRWMLENMVKNGVDTSLIVVSDEPGGHAIIQVDGAGQNSIVIFGGTNQQLARDEVDRALEGARPADVILLQNETNLIPYIMERADERSLPVCFNAAPMDSGVPDYPLALVSTFFINETEGEAFTGREQEEEIVDEMLRRFPSSHVVLTLGKEGVLFGSRQERIRIPEYPVEVVDTTAAGDAFTGYYMAGLCEELPVEEMLIQANIAASLSVMKPGATDSIPMKKDLPPRDSWPSY